ncbi:PREDICTED: crk-like protein [Amphimedon queenslandica]|uniref:Uncharacterized protein n=1 Tax=Amphimedon queenslandica TaxID=400682 RepID=A0A1X7VI65_AMPQE|nr:PREDICTED: crk-like protein [Amphimedon queenslandica]|eukprot:XP_003384218.1 PREDICTED: crk-like protein [Amphimedon queenslandica]
MALPELKSTIWYHGRVDRPTCESLLISKRPGSFLVRDSATCLGDYVLSVSENNKVSHYIISRRGPLYLIGDQSFQDLFSVIEFYKMHFLDTTTLTEAVPPPGRSYPPPQSHPPIAASPMTGPVHPGVLPPPEQVVGRLVVRGKFEFRSNDPEDLQFNKGDKMIVIRKDEDEWWFAQHEDGRQGAIPVPYVEVVEEQPLKARALSDRDCPYDPTALSFKKGEIIKILKKNDNGMWEGETSSGKRGHFPFKLVDLV